MSANTPMVRLAAFTAASNLVLPLTSLATAPILARELGAQGRGEMAAVVSPLFILMFVANVGLPEATVYVTAKLKERPASVWAASWRLSLVYGVIAAAGLWVAAPHILRNADQVVPLMRGVVVLLPLMMLTIVLRSLVVGMREYAIAAAERVLTPILRLGSFVALLLSGHLTVTTATVAQVLTTASGSILLGTVAWRRRGRMETTDSPHPRLMHKVATFGLLSWGGTFGNLINWRLDQAVLVVLVSPRQLGYYVVAVGFSELSSSAVAAVRNLVFTESAHRESFALVSRAGRVVIVLVSISAVVGFVLAGPVVRLLFGGEFEPSVSLARVLLVAAIPFCADQVVASGVVAAGFPGRRSVGQVISAGLTVLGLVLLAPTFGAMGAAVTSLVAYSTNFAISVFQFHRISKIPVLRILSADQDDVRWFGGQMRRLVKRAER